MSNFREQFTARYKDTPNLKRQTKKYEEEYKAKFKKEAVKVTIPTSSKLGKRL